MSRKSPSAPVREEQLLEQSGEHRLRRALEAVSSAAARCLEAEL